MILWFLVFSIASPGASSVHLTVSEVFPLKMRSQAMAIFFAIGLGCGGVIAPFIFGSLIQKNSREYIAFGYLVASIFMIAGAVASLLFGIDAERKSLEQITSHFS